MITAKNYGIDIDKIRSKIYHFKKQKITYFVTVTFITGKQKEIILDKVGSKSLPQIDELLKSEKPDKIQIEYFKSDCEKRNDVKIYAFQDVSEQINSSIKTQFQGLGEAEITSLVDQRFRDQKRAEEFIQLQEQVSELTSELDEQRELVEELETENEQLKTELEQKKQVRYYAGMLGDILEGIGISKDKIRNPIASLMGISDTEKPKEVLDSTNTAHSTQAQHDSSGIVEDEVPLTKEQEERKVIITLITHYLDAADNKTLAQVFTVFSAIEHNSEKASEIITFLKSQNT
jgi:hypothetical protein